MIRPVILSGGAGTRLWPLSRELHPKQFLQLAGAHTLLQETALRVLDLDGCGEPMVVCNEEHRFKVAEQMREVMDRVPSILLEPEARNTAPAILAAALACLADDADEIMLVLPADHYVGDAQGFARSVAAAARFAEQGDLVTMGIRPEGPETGYGYIRHGAEQEISPEAKGFTVDRFVEKPDMERAREYVESGEYYWNSGIFVFRASVLLTECEKHHPDMVKACRAAMDSGGRDLDFFRLGPEFADCERISIDHAVMEKTDKALVVPFQSAWNDLGSWEALWQVGDKDEHENVRVGDVIVHDVHHSYLHAESRLLTVIGVTDHVVVETADAVLVTPRDRVQDVKGLVDELRSRGREEATTHQKVYRPWGSYETLNLEDRFQVKRITVKPGAVLSLQKHFHRAEHWVVVSGTAVVTRGEETLVLKEDQSTYIPLGTLHRIENPGKIPLELIEVQTGSYLGEDDIVRFDDKYGRSG